MTRIHHATAKKAADAQITLIDVSETETQASYTSSTGVEIVCLTSLPPKTLVELMLLRKTLVEEYPAIDVWHTDGWYVLVTRENSEEMDEAWEDLPELATVLEAADSLEIDLTASEDDEPEDTGSIVKSAYKEIYRQRGNPNNCGDWLAKFLDDAYTIEATEVNETTGKAKKVKSFDVTSFTELLELNGVDFSGKWAQLPNSGQKGWRGRYRMNGRQKLEIVVAINGFLRTNQGDVQPEANWLEEIQAKHTKAIVKHQDKLDKILGVTDE